MNCAMVSLNAQSERGSGNHRGMTFVTERVVAGTNDVTVPANRP